MIGHIVLRLPEQKEAEYMMNIERELKVMLTKEQYDRLCGEFEWDRVICQTNHYYRCGNTKLFSSIRVREIDGEFFLQVKMPVSEEGALSVKKEYEKKLESLPPVLTDKELKDLTGADFGCAVPMGALFTERRSAFMDGCEICLDRSEYLGVTDYEAELEYTGEFPKALVERFESMGIDFDKPPLGKYARFIGEAKKMGEKQENNY